MKRSILCLLTLTVLLGLLTVLFTSEQNATAADHKIVYPVNIKVAPEVIVLSSLGGRLTVHAEIAYWVVDKQTLRLNGLIPFAVKADARGELVAAFDIDDVKAMVSPPKANFMFHGMTKLGDCFFGTDTVRVID